MITIKINQLVIIRGFNHFSVIWPIRFQLKVYYYFDIIFKILIDLSMFRILSHNSDLLLIIINILLNW